MSKPIYRISSVGNCARALSADRIEVSQDITSPPWLITSEIEGTRQESWIKEDLRNQSWTIEEGGLCLQCKEEFKDERFGIHVELDLGFARLLGHMDGRATNYEMIPGVKFILEVKTRSQYEFDRWKKGGFPEFPENEAQITCYMEADKNNNVFYVVKNRSNGYIEKNFLKKQPIAFQSIINKLELVESYVAKGELAPAVFNELSIQCKRCNRKGICIPEVREFNAVPSDMLMKATEEYRKGKLMEEQGKQLQDDAKAILMEQSKASGQKKYNFNQLVINHISVKESVTYPKSNLLKIFTAEELSQAAEVKNSYEFLRIDDLREEK